MNISKLPADPSALVLGIVALVLGFAGCCCYGIVAVIPLIISIIGLVAANKSLKEYAANPEAYSAQSKSNVSTGKILNIIAIIFNGIVVLFFMGVLVIYGTLFSSALFDEFRNFKDFENYENEGVFEFEEDSTYNDSEYYESEIITDSIVIDSLNISH